MALSSKSDCHKEFSLGVKQRDEHPFACFSNYKLAESRRLWVERYGSSIRNIGIWQANGGKEGPYIVGCMPEERRWWFRKLHKGLAFDLGYKVYAALPHIDPAPIAPVSTLMLQARYFTPIITIVEQLDNAYSKLRGGNYWRKHSPELVDPESEIFAPWRNTQILMDRIILETEGDTDA